MNAGEQLNGFEWIPEPLNECRWRMRWPQRSRRWRLQLKVQNRVWICMQERCQAFHLRPNNRVRPKRAVWPVRVPRMPRQRLVCILRPENILHVPDGLPAQRNRQSSILAGWPVCKGPELHWPRWMCAQIAYLCAQCNLQQHPRVIFMCMPCGDERSGVPLARRMPGCRRVCSKCFVFFECFERL